MPPADSLVSCLRALTIRSSCPRQASRAFTSTARDEASAVHSRKRHRDPYALAQARARKAANLSRQEVLKKERASALGDPVRGITTPFVQSFDNALPSAPSPPSSTNLHTAGQNEAASKQQPPPGPNALNDAHINYFLTPDELQKSLKRSEFLSHPALMASEAYTRSGEEQGAAPEEAHATATEALNRIASLANGSSKDRLRVNIQRCIDSFGRHNTENYLAPRTAAVAQSSSALQLGKTPRVGPDTGSSEVQIAILTAKIRTLADFLQTRGRTDKVNKRNLRLLVHRRQKHLQYLRRKERGGPRWQNVISTLGLTEGTWRGEISL